MKSALITGINGFVGPYLKKELESNGYEVFGFGLEEKEEPNYFSVDITDAEQVSEKIKQIKPTHIFHLAGISSPPVAAKNPELTHDVNVNGTKNVLDACLELENPSKILVVSSAHVYGEPQGLPVTEDHPLSGKGAYGESRVAQEELVKDYTDKLDIVVTRSFNHTGPAQTDIVVVAKIVKHIVEIAKGKREKLEMGNNVKRDFTDVRDVVRAYRLLLEQEKFNITVNVCRGESIALKDIIDRVKVLAQLNDLEVETNPEFVRKNDVMDMYGSIEKLQSYIDWQPEISYEKMIEDIYKYWDKEIK